MNSKLSLIVISILALSFLGANTESCNSSQPMRSDSGVTKASVKVDVDNSGRSVEQRLIIERLRRDNKPGSFKYIYIISPYTGSVLLQSVAVGKVISSGKRLTPKSTEYGNAISGVENCMEVVIANQKYCTNEVMQDDGTFGDSSEYLYWFTPTNQYHQVYVGGLYVHVSDQPILVKNSVLTMEVDTSAKQPEPIGEIKEIMKAFNVEK